MKLLLLVVLAGTSMAAEPRASWWAYASPEATALVGIKWASLRNSPLAATIQNDLSPTGTLGFPDLDCLRQAREIVIASPSLVAIESGSFPEAAVAEQAQSAKLQRSVYKDATLWLSEPADALGIAWLSEEMVLVGTRATLEAAIDNAHALETRQPPPLVTRATHLSTASDLWVVADKLPNPLASLFVPIDANGSEFLGQISLRDGVAVEASFDTGSDTAAEEFARGLRERVTSLPEVAHGLDAKIDKSRVTITLQVSAESALAVLQPKPVTFEIMHVEASQPQIIRIYNLDEGTRETVFQIYR